MYYNIKQMNIIPVIPCIKDKCLLLSVCKSKEEISCDELSKYLYYIYNTDNLKDLQKLILYDELSYLLSKATRILSYSYDPNKYEYTRYEYTLHYKTKNYFILKNPILFFKFKTNPIKRYLLKLIKKLRKK